MAVPVDERQTSAPMVPTFPAEPVGRPTEPTILKGEWISRTSRVGGYAVLERASGGGVMLDALAVRFACLALGIEIRE